MFLLLAVPFSSICLSRGDQQMQDHSRLVVPVDSISSTLAKKLFDLIASSGFEAGGLANGLPAAVFFAKGFLPAVEPSNH